MKFITSIISALYRVKRLLIPKIYIGRYPLFRQVKARFLAERPIKVGQFQFFADKVDTLRLLGNRDYAQDEQSHFQSIIKPGYTCVDLGANIGFFSVLFAHWTGPNGKVFAFEPSPENLVLLRKNLKINGISNVEIVDKAVSDEEGVIKLHLCKDNFGDNRIYASEEEKDRKTVDIQAIKLDDFFASKSKPIDFIKMDIQGAELRALKGMKHLLENKQIQRISMEFWPCGLVKSGSDPVELLDLLLSYGFTLYDLYNGSLIETSASSLIERYPASDNIFTNLYVTTDVNDVHLVSSAKI